MAYGRWPLLILPLHSITSQNFWHCCASLTPSSIGPDKIILNISLPWFRNVKQIKNEYEQRGPQIDNQEDIANDYLFYIWVNSQWWSYRRVVHVATYPDTQHMHTVMDVQREPMFYKAMLSWIF